MVAKSDYSNNTLFERIEADGTPNTVGVVLVDRVMCSMFARVV
jgi:hypothetical protein